LMLERNGSPPMADSMLDVRYSKNGDWL